MSALLTFIKKRLEYRRNQRLDRSELERLKLKKFRQLVSYVNLHSPYYQDIIRQRNIDPNNCHPTDFPVLNKKTLMENFDDIVTDRRINRQTIKEFLLGSKDPNNLLFDHYRIVHTSGSSGEVGYFVYSPEEWAVGSSQANRSKYGPRPPRQFVGRIRVVFYGATEGHFTGMSVISSIRKSPARFIMNIKTLEINHPLPQTIDTLNQFQPHIMFGYPGALKILANKQQSGELSIKPIALSTGGESLSKADWQILNQAFHCNVLNVYGCSEHLMMGIADLGNEQMYLFDDDLIYEINPDHTLITNLFNYTLPLIRYYMSDVLHLQEDMSLAKPYLLIKSLVGRNEVVPRFINDEGQEDFISPHTINEIFVPGVNRFQMQLVDEKQFTFKACLDATLAAAQQETAVEQLQERLKEILAQKKMTQVQFDVRVVDEIPLNPRSRKFQLIVE